MSEITKIDYVDHTWSPWRGCEKVSPGCENCYAEALAKRVGLDCYGPGKQRIKTKDWKKPRRWNKYQFQCFKCKAWIAEPETLGNPFSCPQCNIILVHRNPRVFPSLCDWLDDQVPIEWLAEFLQLIYDTPNLTWLLLTKRPENFFPLLQTIGRLTWTKSRDMANRWTNLREPPENIWFGVTCENQEMADKRIPLLLDIPAKVRWVSCEPLLAPIRLHAKWLLTPISVDWAVVGGESGSKFRGCDIEWITEIADRCRETSTKAWVKQDCGRSPGWQGRIPDEYWNLKQLPK